MYISTVKTRQIRYTAVEVLVTLIEFKIGADQNYLRYVVALTSISPSREKYRYLHSIGSRDDNTLLRFYT